MCHSRGALPRDFHHEQPPHYRHTRTAWELRYFLRTLMHRGSEAKDPQKFRHILTTHCETEHSILVATTYVALCFWLAVSMPPDIPLII